MKIDRPEWLFHETLIFHITHINNLENILSSGFLYSINTLIKNHTSIASEDVQKKRASKGVTQHPYGVLHDYVPFYFAPRSPMLYANYNASLPNAKAQNEIIYLVSYAEKIHQNKRPYVFYDVHPIKEYASCYNDIKDLSRIDWDLFFEGLLIGGYSKYWQDVEDNEAHPKWINRKAIRQAEFLIHKEVCLQDIIGIATMTQDAKDVVDKKINQIKSEKNNHILIKIKKDWYY
jgi:hypothetical protein